MSNRWTTEEYAAYLERQQAARVPSGETRAWEAREAETFALEPEGKFMARVIALAKLYSWEHYHTWRSDKSPAGFPDIVLCNGQSVLFIECKTNRGQVTVAQQRWLSLLEHAGQEVYVWRPKDFDAIKARLEKRVFSS